MKQWLFNRCHCGEVDMIYMIIYTSTESFISFFYFWIKSIFILYITILFIYEYVYTHRVFSCLYSSQSQSFLFADRTLGSKGHILRRSSVSSTSQQFLTFTWVSSSLPQWTSVFMSLFQIQSTFWAQDLKSHLEWKLLFWRFVDSFRITMWAEVISSLVALLTGKPREVMRCLNSKQNFILILTFSK